MRLEMTPAGKLVGLVLGLALLGFVAVHQAPDLRRYVKAERM